MLKKRMELRSFKLISNRYLKRSALRVWTENQPDIHLSTRNIKSILDTSWDNYQTKAAEIPKQSNLGNWLMINFAYLTMAANQALVDFGISEETSRNLIKDLTWDIASTWTKRGQKFSNVFFQNQMKQLEFFVDLIMKTLFSPPGYQFERGNTKDGFFLDVHQCPVAEIMNSNGTADLCIQAWCGVDFGLVEILGGNLKRSGTIAMGKKKCDFVFHPPA